MEKVINGFPEYRINQKGEVFSSYKFKTGKIGNEWRLVKHVLDKGVGYYIVTLVNSNTKKRANKFIHRLLAEHYIPNPENKAHVNHIDGNKQNNCLSNLEWCTPKENSIHAVKNGLTTYEHCSKPVKQLNPNTLEVLATFKSAVEAEAITGVAKQNISKVLRGLRPRAGGYVWQYI